MTFTPNPGRKSLRRLAFARETENGTATPATTIWRGAGAVLDDTRVIEAVEEDIGLFDGTDRVYMPMVHSKLNLSATPATFEQIQHLFSNAFGGPVTGVADGVGSGRVYTTTIPVSNSPTNISWTLEGGDDREVERTTYAKVLKISLVGAKNKAVTMAAELIAREVLPLPGGFTGVPLPVVEEILNQRARVFLDPIGGTYGATPVSRQVVGWKIDLMAKWVPKFTMDDNLAFSFAQFVGKEITGEITFEHDTAALGVGGEKAAWRNRVPRLLQLRFIGSNLATAGTYTTKTLIINLPIRWTKFDPLDDDDDNNIVIGKFFSKYNTTAGNAGNIIVVNELSTL